MTSHIAAAVKGPSSLKQRLIKAVTAVLLILVLFTLIDGFRAPSRQIVTRFVMVKMIEGYQQYISAVFFSKVKICRYTPT
jgi:hypothetical protein